MRLTLLPLLAIAMATGGIAAPGAGSILMPTCAGGQVRIPLGPAPAPDDGKCPMACHVGCNRKPRGAAARGR